MIEVAGTDIAGVLLAAGRATRFSGGHPDKTKLIAKFCGEPLVRIAARAALEAGVRPLIVVTGHARQQVLCALDGLDLREAYNRDYAAGLAGSLRMGLENTPKDCAGAFILLGDMPQVSAALLTRLAKAFDPGRYDAIVPLVRGQRGNPALLAASLFAPAKRLSGDEGARRLLRAPSIRVRELPMDDFGALADVDDFETLERLSQASL